jgi:hypothetical protein
VCFRLAFRAADWPLLTGGRYSEVAVKKKHFWLQQALICEASFELFSSLSFPFQGLKGAITYIFGRVQKSISEYHFERSFVVTK